MIGDVVFYTGVVWLAVLLGVCVVLIARAGSPSSRIVALDLMLLVLIGVLTLVAGQDGTAYALDAALALALLSFVATLAACRYLEDRRPFS